jgi:hypothetical protein
MPTNYFSLIDSRQASSDGKIPLSVGETSTEVLRGHVAHIAFTADAAGNNPRITVKQDVTKPIGLINDYLSHQYPHQLTPTAGRNIVAHLKGKPVAYVYGDFRALVGGGLFHGTAPVAGNKIYANGAEGKLTVVEPGGAGNGIACGVVLRKLTITDVDGDVFECAFQFNGIAA